MAKSNTAHYRRNVNARWKANRKAEQYTQASPVRITRADGSVEERPAYTEGELKQIVDNSSR